MTIGKIIANYRKNMNITQETLAQKLGVTNQAVSKWEADQSCPDIQLLPEIADIFGITIDELFGRTSKTQQIQTGLPWENDNTLRVVLFKGHTLVHDGHPSENITFQYEGPALNVESAISVHCGDVSGSVDAGTDVCCGNVGGSVDAGANVCCGDVGSSVDAGANVSCGVVGGDIDAGMSVTCGDVGGDVDAGTTVECGHVEGDIDAGGPVTIKK